MKANVIVSPPRTDENLTTVQKRIGRRMSPVTKPNTVTRTVPKSSNIRDISSLLDDANTVLECTYSDNDVVFVRIINGYGQRVYMLVDQNNISVDNKMYQKDCTIEKNAIYTEKSFESYATLCKNNDIGCAVEHHDKIFISLGGQTYLIYTTDNVILPTYYPATSVRKIMTPNLFNRDTSHVYSEMRTTDTNSIAEGLDELYSMSDSITKTIDDIGYKYNKIIERLFKQMNSDIKSRDKLSTTNNKSLYLEKVAALKTNNERVIEVNTMTDTESIYSDLDKIKVRLDEVLNKLSDYMKEI